MKGRISACEGANVRHAQTDEGENVRHMKKTKGRMSAYALFKERENVRHSGNCGSPLISDIFTTMVSVQTSIQMYSQSDKKKIRMRIANIYIFAVPRENSKLTLWTLRKVSIRISLSMPRRLTWKGSFRLLWIFCFRNHFSIPLYP